MFEFIRRLLGLSNETEYERGKKDAENLLALKGDFSEVRQWYINAGADLTFNPDDGYARGVRVTLRPHIHAEAQRRTYYYLR